MRMHASKHIQQAHGFASRFYRVSILCSLICSTTLHAAAQTKVTTWHYNNGRTGANTTEKILTPSNVKVSTFGKQFTQPVDGFNDVLTGANGLYTSLPFYDFTTGLGSLDLAAKAAIIGR